MVAKIIVGWLVLGLIGYVIGIIVDMIFYRKEIINPLLPMLAGPVTLWIAFKSLRDRIKSFIEDLEDE